MPNSSPDQSSDHLETVRQSVRQSKPSSHLAIGMGGTILLVIFIGLGLFWGDRLPAWLEWAPQLSRQLKGEVFGSMPKPTQPNLSDPVKELVVPKTTHKMAVKRIPQLRPNSPPMPHPYWGPCTQCHLIQGGPPPGSQPITPVGKIWEKASTIHKVGPPILPNSSRPHPASGRCIKCHDIVVEVPI